MKAFFPCIPVLALAVAGLAPAADLGQLQSSFMARYDEANATRDDQLKKLEGSYIGALERYSEKVRGAGDLAKVVPARDEIEAIKTGIEPLPALAEGTDPEFRTMRDKYVAARDSVHRGHAQTLIDLSGKMSVALEAQEKELTKANRIDDALTAKRMRETLDRDPGITAARERLAKGVAAAPSSAKWKLLLEQGMEVEERGMQAVGTLSEVAQEGRGFWSRLLTGGDEKDADRILVTPSPARVSFKPEPAARELRGKVSLAFPAGRVTVRIKAGGKQVFEEELDGGKQSARIDLEISPSDSIEIETESGGMGRGPAWVYWEEFESR